MESLRRAFYRGFGGRGATRRMTCPSFPPTPLPSQPRQPRGQRRACAGTEGGPFAWQPAARNAPVGRFAVSLAMKTACDFEPTAGRGFGGEGAGGQEDLEGEKDKKKKKSVIYTIAVVCGEG